MYKNKRFVALIPARGGSIGIPKKNVCLLNGKPLIRYTVETAEKSNFLDGIYCTTDDDEIANVASTNSRCKIIKRPSELATSTSKTIDCIIHALSFLKEKGQEFDYFIILQPTSPLRTTKEIDDFIQHIVDYDLPSCVSISPLPYLPILMRHVKTGDLGELALENVIEGCGTIRRQDARPTYYVDGSMCSWTTKEVLGKKTQISLNDAKFGFINDQLIDINTKDDLFLCECLLKKK